MGKANGGICRRGRYFTAPPKEPQRGEASLSKSLEALLDSLDALDERPTDDPERCPIRCPRRGESAHVFRRTALECGLELWAVEESNLQPWD